MHSQEGVIDLIIGVDIPEVHVDMEVSKGSDDPIAKHSPLGWVVIGNNGGRQYQIS